MARWAAVDDAGARRNAARPQADQTMETREAMTGAQYADAVGFPVPWWLRPHSFILLFIVPVTALIYLADLTGLQEWNWFLNVGNLTVFFAFLLIASGASYFASANIRTTTPGFSFHLSFGFIDFVAIVAIAAHVIWFRRIFIFLDFSLLETILFRRAYHIREVVDTIPGLTTLSQTYIAFSVFYAINLACAPKVKTPRRHHVFFFILLFFALFQAFAWAARLALFEYLIPVVIVFAREYRRIWDRRWLVSIMRAGPVLALPVGFVVFAVFEYSRSWNFYRNTYGGGYLEFAFSHFVLYYASSINNGAGLLETYGSSNFTFIFLFEWLYKLPLGIGAFFADLFGADKNLLKMVLETQLNRRFTTFTGVFPYLFDLGIPFGLLFAAIYGSVYGLCYRSFVRGAGLGCALYPTLYVALLELLRIGYLFDGRYVYPFVFILLGYRYFRRGVAEDRATPSPDATRDVDAAFGDRRTIEKT